MNSDSRGVFFRKTGVTIEKLQRFRIFYTIRKRGIAVSNKAGKDNNSRIWFWVISSIIVIAAVILLLLQPWKKDSAADPAATKNPSVTEVSEDGESSAETSSAETNSALGKADQAAAAQATGEQQSVEIKDTAGVVDTIRLQDEIEDSEGKEGVYSIHLKDSVVWGNDSEADTETALAVIKDVMDKSTADGYDSCAVYVYQANNCMAFMWFQFNPQYLSLFGADGSAGDTIVLTDEQVAALGATIPDWAS